MNTRSTTAPTRQTTVLVTGGTGYVGGYTIARLLRDGYIVRTTVRAKDREKEILATLAGAGIDPEDRLEFAVADLASDAGWADAAHGIDYVLHVASPFPPSIPENDDEVIIPARDGALRVLTAARDAGVKRVVMTSSFAAIGYSRKPSANYTEDDWTNPDDDNTAYIKSKTIAERAAWDFIQAEGGALELTVINPTGIFGPLLNDHLSTSIGLVKAMLDGLMPAVPRMHFGVVDVRDVADIHVLAMTNSAAAGQRFIATSDESSSFFGLAQLLARHLGEAGRKLPAFELTDDQVREAAKTNPGLKEAAGQLGQIPVISNEKAKTVLGWQPRSAEDTIVDTADSLIEHGLLAE